MIKVKNIINIIVIILLVSMILRLSIVIIHLNHNCTHDDNCLACILIHKLKEEFNGFDPNLTKVIIANLLIFTTVTTYLDNKIINKKKDTLIGLKVELLS